MSKITLKEVYFNLKEYVPPDYKEPKRNKHAKLSGADIGLKPNEGYHNILALIRRGKLTREEIDFWADWYPKANEQAQLMASEYDIPVVVAAAVIAVLSPGARWKQNLVAASKVIENWLHMGDPEKFPVHHKTIAAYKANIYKAYQILETGDLSFVRGPKVTTFFKSIADPSSIPNDIVLDGHAINIWRGHKVPIKNMRQPTKAERLAMEQDYAKVADILGLTPQQVQAVSWYVWKSVYDAPEPPTNVVPVEQPEERIDESLKTTKVNRLFESMFK